MDEVDVIIVGAGLAGLSAALNLSGSGLDVLLIERGEFPGSKNVSGGRLYLEPVRHLLGGLLDSAPFERKVVRERMAAVAGDRTVELSFEGGKFRKDPPHSVTVLRTKLDKWLGERAAEKGVFVVSGFAVDGVLKESGRVAGVTSGGERIRGKAVIAADGVLSATAVKSGLRPEWRAGSVGVGVKEVIGLDKGRLHDRFQLDEGEGEARLFFGSFTEGLSGGGFVYTNEESVSLGVVLGVEELLRLESASSRQILDAFKSVPAVSRLISGGELLEYSAHSVFEGGLKACGRLYGDGILVAGDAAGFGLNAGLTQRGMEFALASGALAAEALKRAAAKGDFSARALRVYADLMRASPLWKDLKAFSGAPRALSHAPLRREYPAMTADLFERLFTVGPGRKRRASSEVFRFVLGRLFSLRFYRDLLRFRSL